ncbi:MAG: hypothetical protein KAS72_09945 [Phycisphaerales bacterium]|nr:hypothetical protein [Phycisphaerales bacterium]
MIRLGRIGAVVLLCAGSAFGQLVPTVAPFDTFSQVQEVMRLGDFTIQSLELPAAMGEGFVTTVVIDGQERMLLLHPHSMRSADYQLLVDSGSGAVPVESAAPSTYRGHVLGVGGSRAAASLVDGQLSALIDMADGRLWFVQPLTDAVPGADPADHVVYDKDDSIPGDWTCGNDMLLPPVHDHDDGGDGYGTRGGGTQIAEIAFDADYEYYQLNGSSVSATETDIENVLNDIDLIYDRDVDITYTLTTIIVRSSPSDPYTSSDAGTLLNQFRTEWNSNQGGVQRDLAHLMTGRELNGSVIGVAWVGVVCNLNYAYGLSQSRFTTNFNYRVTLTSHEMGHNWDADHCDQDGFNCKIMCSGLGGCGGVGLPNFGDRSVNDISSFRDSRSCLDDGGEPSGIAHQIVDVTITGDAKADDPTLNHAKTYDLQVVITEDDDWTSTDAVVTIDGVIYQHPDFDSDTPQPGWWASFPSLEFDSFFSARDFATPAFVGGATVTTNSMAALWFDTDNSGNGTYAIGRFTLTAGQTLSVSGSSTANHTQGDLHPFDFQVEVGFPGIEHQLVEVPISSAAKTDDPTLDGAKTFDLQVIITNDDDWTSTDGTATIDGSFYQHPSFDSDTPQPGWWASFPSLEFDSFFSGYDFDAPAFAEGPTVTNDSMSAVWFDTVNAGNGTYTIGRFTVTAGTTLLVSGASTANHTQGELHSFGFEIEVDLNDCPGDFDGDGYRGQSDLGILLAAYELTGAGDIDGDGDTDQADLGAFLAVYDTPCP